MDFILGRERILHLRESGTSTWHQVAYLTSNEINESSEFIGTTVRSMTNGYRTSIPIGHQYEIAFSAIMIDDAFLGSKTGLKKLREFKSNRTFLEWKLEALNRNFTDYGNCYVQDLGEVADVGDFVTFSGNLRGYGPRIDLEDTEPPTAPFLNLLEVSTTQITLNWTESVDNLAVVGYQIRRNEGSFNETIFDVGNIVEYEDLAVVQGQFYSYNVRAYDVAGNFSSWSNKRSAFVPIPQTSPFNYLLRENGEPVITETGEPILL